MKYVGGKSQFNSQTGEWESRPRMYTNFYCSLKEWSNLGRGKENFMYQVRSAIVDLFGYTSDEECGIHSGKTSEIKLKNGLVLNKLSFDRCGRRDSLAGEKYSANIVKHAIKLITNRDADVEFYSWKGCVDHIEIVFKNCNMPNLIILIDEYSGSTNKELIACIDAIYETLNTKSYQQYDDYLYKYFNNDYDFIFYKSNEDATGNYNDWDGVWMWKDRFIKKEYRHYDSYGTITYQIKK